MPSWHWTSWTPRPPLRLGLAASVRPRPRPDGAGRVVLPGAKHRAVGTAAAMPRSLLPQAVQDCRHIFRTRIPALEPDRQYPFVDVPSEYGAPTAGLSEMKALVANILKDRYCGATWEAETWTRAYGRLAKEDKKRHLGELWREVGRLHTAVACDAYRSASEAPNAEENGASDSIGKIEVLRRPERPQPECQTVFETVAKLPDGAKILVDIKADLEDFAREIETTAPATQSFFELARCLKDVLRTMFAGSLRLDRITWHSPGVVLEKIAMNERVHAVKDWRDLKRRVGPYRRLYGLFHESSPLEPLASVQVALVGDMVGSIRDILPVGNQGPTASGKIRVANFYSISARRGLTGIDLGGSLIKRVVGVLLLEYPSLGTFATLSPIPGFRAWLKTQVPTEPSITKLLPREKGPLGSLARKLGKETSGLFAEMLLCDDWYADEEKMEAMRAPLLRLCARYLLKEKRNGSAIDPVANFHLRNGASVHRINWGADVSANGMRQSFGNMVNYNYLLDRLDENAAVYAVSGNIHLSRDDPLLLQFLEKR